MMSPDPEILKRQRARSAVALAVQRGHLKRVKTLVCISCGRPAQEYDHVQGYEESAWLTVEPVCIPCHRSRASSRLRYHPRIRFEGHSAREVIEKFRAWMRQRQETPMVH
mgnify:CR=1 FL=1